MNVFSVVAYTQVASFLQRLKQLAVFVNVSLKARSSLLVEHLLFSSGCATGSTHNSAHVSHSSVGFWVVSRSVGIMVLLVSRSVGIMVLLVSRSVGIMLLLSSVGIIVVSFPNLSVMPDMQVAISVGIL